MVYPGVNNISMSSHEPLTLVLEPTIVQTYKHTLSLVIVLERVQYGVSSYCSLTVESTSR